MTTTVRVVLPCGGRPASATRGRSSSARVQGAAHHVALVVDDGAHGVHYRENGNFHTLDFTKRAALARRLAPVGFLQPLAYRCRAAGAARAERK